MTIKSWGDFPLSMSDIRDEFGGTGDLPLSEYYAGGVYVPAGAVGYPGGTATAIPSSGAISIANFFGSANRIARTIYLGSTNNYVLNTAKVTGYVAGLMDITLDITSGAVVGSGSTGAYALTVDTSWAANDTITIINRGYILGRAGNGGNPAIVYEWISGTNSDKTPQYSSDFVAATAGSAGGPAMYIRENVDFYNYGTIGAGGGGGGAGGQGYYQAGDVFKPTTYWLGGGGGGGGRGQNGGSGGTTPPPPRGSSLGTAGAAGGAGSYLAAGNGGVYASGGGARGGTGGAGGNLAANGAAGGTANPNARAPSAGGAAGGTYINGAAYVTWQVTGLRYGTAI